jgi:Gaa1-like, GPI transamidase component
MISARAGIIQEAINLEFPGVSDYSHMGLFARRFKIISIFLVCMGGHCLITVSLAGLNGQQPNADVVTTIVKVSQWEGIPLTLFNNVLPHNGWSEWDRYTTSASNLIKYFGYQSLGHPIVDHAFYLK